MPPTGPAADGLSAEAAIIRMSVGFWITQALYVVAELGVADLLDRDTPRPVGELATEAGAAERPLYRVLRALAGLGLVREHSGERFTLTDRGTPLRGDSPDTVRSTLLVTGEEQYQAWGSFLHNVRTGGTAFEHRFGQSVFDYYRDRPRESARFNQAMRELTREQGHAVAAAYDFSDVHVVLDVGGGNGSLLSAILTRHPHLAGILFDQEVAVEQARQGAGGPLPNCRFVAGDFFDKVPVGADLITVKHTVHNWPDEDAVRILRNCRDALSPTGRLLVLETVIGPAGEPSFGTLLDLQMMALPGGQVRTEAEHARLLDRAGLRLGRVVRLPAVDIVEAMPKESPLP
ncbi:methyltransferase [Streptomyces sp. 8P21H-1]|uniref:methyltransferase n=1 Tax=Streptomyces sp. 8P21H-1 TaxID=2737048 RepID=UPI0015710C11|nr:methyltransferase [Streptomyces sp. 8P21H-1]NSL43108.1 methyltransferase domain-containing protein [Streptomyces sp. 8P21H-1]